MPVVWQTTSSMVSVFEYQTIQLIIIAIIMNRKHRPKLVAAIGFMAPAAVIVLALLVMVISFFTFNPGLQACSHITESDCTANTMHMPLTGPYRDGESGYQ